MYIFYLPSSIHFKRGPMSSATKCDFSLGAALQIVQLPLLRPLYLWHSGQKYTLLISESSLLAIRSLISLSECGNSEVGGNNNLIICNRSFLAFCDKECLLQNVIKYSTATLTLSLESWYRSL